jgi:polar amino acid transport system permease protein
MTHYTSPSLAKSVLWTLALLLGVSGLIYVAFARVHYQWNWAGFWLNRGIFVEGWLSTLLISFGALVLSLILGFALMLGGRAPWEPVRRLFTSYVTLVRGTPLLVQLLIGYYGIAQPLFHTRSPMLIGIVLLASFEAAYLAEIFRGALESIGRSQHESARSVGFDTWQMYRYVLVPQALRRALPATAGEMVSLVKNSSLLSVLGIEELTQMTRLINSRSYTALEGFIPLGIAYLCLTLPLTWWAQRLERRFAYET